MSLNKSYGNKGQGGVSMDRWSDSIKIDNVAQNSKILLRIEIRFKNLHSVILSLI